MVEYASAATEIGRRTDASPDINLIIVHGPYLYSKHKDGSTSTIIRPLSFPRTEACVDNFTNLFLSLSVFYIINTQ